MMRLTIATETKSIGKDGVFYGPLDFSACNIPANVWALQWNEHGNNKGHIEYIGPIPNEEITSLPGWANNCLSVWEQKDYDVKNPPAPTPEQIIAANELRAKRALFSSDWTQAPDVNLANKAEWVTYRQALRIIATNPTVDPVWPTEPQVVWA